MNCKIVFFFIFTEDFNKKILNPDLSESDLIYLHNDLKILYKNYCSSDGSDRINFEENIINELKEGRFVILFCQFNVNLTEHERATCMKGLFGHPYESKI